MASLDCNPVSVHLTSLYCLPSRFVGHLDVNSWCSLVVAGLVMNNGLDEQRILSVLVCSVFPVNILSVASIVYCHRLSRDLMIMHDC